MSLACILPPAMLTVAVVIAAYWRAGLFATSIGYPTVDTTPLLLTT